MPTIKSTDLKLSQPIESDSPDSSLVITVDPNLGMPTGSYIFQLEVLDNTGNRSMPAQWTVTVLDDKAPNAIIKGPKTVGFGVGFTLDGSASVDIGGSISKYIWTLMPQG